MYPSSSHEQVFQRALLHRGVAANCTTVWLHPDVIEQHQQRQSTHMTTIYSSIEMKLTELLPSSVREQLAVYLFGQKTLVD